MTQNEKIIATALVAVTEKAIRLEDNQTLLIRAFSSLLPPGSEPQRILLDAVARVESASDQSAASLAALKAALSQP